MHLVAMSGVFLLTGPPGRDLHDVEHSIFWEYVTVYIYHGTVDFLSFCRDIDMSCTATSVIINTNDHLLSDYYELTYDLGKMWIPKGMDAVQTHMTETHYRIAISMQ